jgi:type III secretion system FlhB-like substrate exporter
MLGRGVKKVRKCKATYKLAVGLEYNKGDASAPVVGVKGERISADEVVKLARRFGVPVIERPELAQALNAIDSNEPISPDLYETVAVILNALDRTA